VDGGVVVQGRARWTFRRCVGLGMYAEGWCGRDAGLAETGERR